MFGGKTFVEEKDGQRLSTQLNATFAIMSDGNWRTLPEIAALLKDQTGKEATTQSISARLRDFRKEKFGGHTVERRRISGGLFEYRLVV